MDLADHFRTIAANWWRILLIAALIGVGVFVFSYNQPNTYQAFTLINVTPNELVAQGNVNTETLSFKVAAFEQILKTQPVADAAALIAPRKYHLTGAQTRGRLSVIPNGAAGLIGIEATATSRQEAVDLSNAFGQALVQQSRADPTQLVKNRAILFAAEKQSLEQQLATANTAQARLLINNKIAEINLAIATNIVDPSQTVTIAGGTSLTNNGNPISPKPARDGVLAFLVAFVLAGEGFVIARAFGDRFARASDVDAITQLTGLPVLAMVPRGRGPNVVEAFRTLRTNLMFLEGSGRPRTIAVVSPNPGAGKSFSCVHLAESAAAIDAQVVIIDADLRRPVLHERLHTSREPGLSDVLRGAPLTSALHKVDGAPGIKLLPSGAPVSDTVAALGGRSFRNLLERLDTAELVIVDTPPGTGYADALAVSAQCDATLLILDADTTRRRSTKQFVDALERTGASLIGVVLNGATVNRRDTYYERG